jgi:hypothetical protein
MYQEHNPLIACAMREDVETFARGIVFAICSIQRQFVTVPEQMAQIERGILEPLYGHKLTAFEYVEEHKLALWRGVLTAPDNATRIDKLCHIPGLGIVKAGFVLQLMGYDVACLDTRNVKREKRDPRAFRSDGPKKKQGPAWHRKIARYLAETEGKAAHYWDTWCRDVAKTYRMTADEVSALHLIIVKPDEMPF